MTRSCKGNKPVFLSFMRTSSLKENENEKKQYLHIAPCGDFWVGDEVFAAKHLQPDYVKSIAIPPNLHAELQEKLETSDDDFDHVFKQVYDSGNLSILIEALKHTTKE